MTHDRPPTPGTDPADPFERELRALLRDRAAGPMPASLRGSVSAAVATPVRPSGLAAWRRPLAGMVAAGIALVLLAGAFNPLSSLLRSALGPAAATTPRASVVPDRKALVWDNGQVRLEADDVIVRAVGMTFHGGPTSGMEAPGSVLWRQSLRPKWFDQGTFLQLDLEFRRDEDTWWLYDGSLSASDVGSTVFASRAITGTVGEPATGDVTLTGSNFYPADGVTASGDTTATIEFVGLRLLPFSGVVARTMDGCTPVVDPDRTTTTDALAAGQLLDGVIAHGMPTEEAAAALQRSEYCYLFERQFRQDGPGGLAGTTEIWCDAPAGVVDSVRYGPGGEARVIVVEDVAPDASPRPQPVLGWGCHTEIAR